MNASDKGVLIAIVLMVAFSIAGAAWFFLHEKSYAFVVEAACDPATETCFTRDCESADAECPVNGLENYKVFRVNAADYARCADGTCAAECTSGTILCKEISCGEGEEDSCALPPEKAAE